MVDRSFGNRARNSFISAHCLMHDFKCWISFLLGGLWFLVVFLDSDVMSRCLSNELKISCQLYRMTAAYALTYFVRNSLSESHWAANFLMDFRVQWVCVSRQSIKSFHLRFMMTEYAGLYLVRNSLLDSQDAISLEIDSRVHFGSGRCNVSIRSNHWCLYAARNARLWSSTNSRHEEQVAIIDSTFSRVQCSLCCFIAG